MRRKIFVSGLIVAMSFAMFTSCGKKTVETAKDEVVEEADNVAEKIKAEDNATSETDVTTKELETDETEANEESTPDVNLLYADVLEQHRDYCQNFENRDADLGSGFYGMTESLYYGGTDAIGYAIEDINNDNVPELIFANINDADMGFGYGSFIYAMWSIVDSKPALIMEGYTRSSYSITKDNKLLYLGSGGAMNSGYGLYTYEPGADALSTEVFFFTDEFPAGSGEMGYFTNNTGEWDVSKSEEGTVDENDFWNTYDEYSENVVDLKLNYLIEKDMYGVGVNHAGVLWDSFSQYESTNIDNDDYSNIIAVYTTEDIKGIRVSKLYFEDVDNNGDGIFSSEELYYSERFDKNNPLILKMTFPGDLPAYGLSFTDIDGNERNIGISVSGKDGSLVLSDVVIK